MVKLATSYEEVLSGLTRYMTRKWPCYVSFVEAGIRINVSGSDLSIFLPFPDGEGEHPQCGNTFYVNGQDVDRYQLYALLAGESDETPEGVARFSVKSEGGQIAFPKEEMKYALELKDIDFSIIMDTFWPLLHDPIYPKAGMKREWYDRFYVLLSGCSQGFFACDGSRYAFYEKAIDCFFDPEREWWDECFSLNAPFVTLLWDLYPDRVRIARRGVDGESLSFVLTIGGTEIHGRLDGAVCAFKPFMEKIDDFHDGLLLNSAGLEFFSEVKKIKTKHGNKKPIHLYNEVFEVLGVKVDEKIALWAGEILSKYRWDHEPFEFRKDDILASLSLRRGWDSLYLGFVVKEEMK